VALAKNISKNGGQIPIAPFLLRKIFYFVEVFFANLLSKHIKKEASDKTKASFFNGKLKMENV